ncbi:glycosyltransferase family 39 protein [Pseudonocardia sp. WMMC193]|uniref:ArnT family glycosyltransferase n=1 Tax=Pseudonocardia sp. WMMC193 TaxID=2911965 RepID=UPI001F26C7EC|nr:glycosyltransferase family 39 protein [Pseudonocardia sp. WMMC193]MCF7547433.1 glycosyltransferase family 39 protein [Pseudonocardia sp. WMMC193]
MTYPGDIWRQSDTATIARNFAANGMNIFFPQINWGGAGPGYVETEFQLLPWLTAATYLVFGEHVVLGRLLSLAFMLVAAAAFWGLARRLLPATPARWALAAFFLSPAFMRWGTAFMPEATVLAFYLLALLGFCRWLQEDRPRFLVWAGAATSVAALVKPTSLHIGLVIGLWVLFTAWERLRRPSLYMAGLAALVAPALWLRHAADMHATYGNTFGVISGGDSKWGSLSMWLSPEFYLGNLRSEAIFIYGLIGPPLAVLGVVWLWRRRRAADQRARPGASPLPLLTAGAIALTVYYFAAGRYTSTDMGIQYHVYSLPYAAVATGVGTAAVLGWVRRRLGGAVTSAVAGAAVLLLGAQSVNVFVQSLPDQAGVFGVCATELDAVSAPDDLVVVSTTSRTTDGAVANNYQEPVVFFLADRKGWSLPADHHIPDEVEALRTAGARFLVVGDRQLVPSDGPLANWLSDNARPLRTTEQNGCAIWDLQSPPETAQGVEVR